MGATGTTLCYHILKKLLNYPSDSLSLEIHCFERNKEIASGLAFKSRETYHVINTSAKDMSIDSSLPEDFRNWLISSDFPHDDGKIPRFLFARYLQTKLSTIISQIEVNSSIKVNFHNVLVKTCVKKSRSYILKTNNTSISFDYIAFCVGHLKEQQKYTENPWDDNSFSQINKDSKVAILGSGLSAIDIILKLSRLNLTHPIDCYSRKRGFPKSQGVHKSLQLHFIKKLHEQRKLTLRDIYRALRKEFLLHNYLNEWVCFFKAFKYPESFDWVESISKKQNSEIYQLLNHTTKFAPLLWNKLKESDQKTFMENHYSTWSSFRHSMPKHNAQIILGLLQEKKLSLPQRIECFDISSKKIRIKGQRVVKTYDHIFDATGYNTTLATTSDPLVKSLITQKIITLDGFGTPLVSFKTCQLLTSNHETQHNIFFIGFHTLGTHFYTNSFELNRNRCEETSDHIINLIISNSANVSTSLI